MNEYTICQEIIDELKRAQAKHPGRIVLRHQAWGIIEEEFEKYKRVVAANDYAEARKRLVSTAAMCLRTLTDWELIQHIESNLMILKRLEPTAPVKTEQAEPGNGN